MQDSCRLVLKETDIKNVGHILLIIICPCKPYSKTYLFSKVKTTCSHFSLTTIKLTMTLKKTKKSWLDTSPENYIRLVSRGVHILLPYDFYMIGLPVLSILLEVIY